MTGATAAAVSVRPIAPEDRAAWERLYRGYRAFYAAADDPDAIETVWSWLHDDAHEVRGLLAEHAGEPVGIAHFRSYARPLTASRGLFLDDLFTAAEARGSGAGTALLDRLAEIARDEGATVVRWITDEGNGTARRLYDRLAQQTRWVTYDLPPAADPAAS
ncbi:GNAT family N-acetyltransferase [Leucobacter allii]|uniref:GNAT family N-acetyltransferase n=1 Tax=Leucobacter allii TaxID=2932247 RepID=UPI001FD08922|nr:GNAT family N-acetyltransferase [Leucobacter allii]UOR01670.1 GNAT family N-acetyltransferase [Leucobacter allii]